MDSNLTVNFNETSSDFSADLSLDEEKNRAVYALGDTETKTTFAPTETAYLQLIPGASTESYSMGSSLGTLSVANSDVLFDYTEDISFASVNFAKLTFIPNSIVTYEWIGNDGGTPTFVNDFITVPSAVIGILRCTYQVLGDRLKLTNANLAQDEYGVLCVVIYDNIKVTNTDGNITPYTTSITVAFATDDSVPSEDVTLEIQVVDMCTGDPVPNANVMVTGYPAGITDANGIFLLNGTVTTGQTYNLKITATDYDDSDLDFIKNDSFTVPSIA